MSEQIIRGYAKLAAFLTRNGFPITRVTLLRWAAEGKGPPEAGRLGTTKMYDPDAVLEWAHAQTQEERRRRGRGSQAVEQTPPSDDDDVVPSF